MSASSIMLHIGPWGWGRLSHNVEGICYRPLSREVYARRGSPLLRLPLKLRSFRFAAVQEATFSQHPFITTCTPRCGRYATLLTLREKYAMFAARGIMRTTFPSHDQEAAGYIVTTLLPCVTLVQEKEQIRWFTRMGLWRPPEAAKCLADRDQVHNPSTSGVPRIVRRAAALLRVTRDMSDTKAQKYSHWGESPMPDHDYSAIRGFLGFVSTVPSISTTIRLHAPSII